MSKYVKIPLKDWLHICQIIGNYDGMIEGVSILKEARIDKLELRSWELQQWFLEIKEQVEILENDNKE